MQAREFDEIVEKAISKIPPPFRRKIRNLAFVVEPEPPRPGLLGTYEGRPLPHRSTFESFSMPDRIVIYQGPHERMACNRRHLEELVAETVWHEVAHYFGLNEGEVRAAERRRAQARLRRRARER